MVDFRNLLSGLQNERDRAERELRQVEDAIKALGSLDGHGGGRRGRPSASTGRRGGRRRMSAAGRARIAAAQRARWAKVRGRGRSGRTAKRSSGRKRRQISAAGLARIRAAQKARWATIRGQKKSPQQKQPAAA
jgi:hypothetical protein